MYFNINNLYKRSNNPKHCEKSAFDFALAKNS